MESTASLSSGAQKMRDGAVELKSAVVNKASEIKDTVMEQGAEKLEICCKETESLIKANPYRSVLIAFGVGALAGMFLFRR